MKRILLIICLLCGCATAGIVLVTGGSGPVADTTAPTPNPATFATPPYAISSTAISMVATTGTDATGVEYSFVETSGNPGATNSGWQSSASYTDSGLTAETQYTYTVQMRDTCGTPNVGTASSGANATTDAAPVGTVYYIDPVAGDNGDDGLSEGNAWATIAYALANAEDGSTVYLMDGASWGDISMDVSSQARTAWEQAITFSPAPGDSPAIEQITIDGGTGVPDVYIILDGLDITDADYGTQRNPLKITGCNYVEYTNGTITGIYPYVVGEEPTQSLAGSQYAVYITGQSSKLVGNVTISDSTITACNMAIVVDSVVNGPVSVNNCEITNFSQVAIQWAPSETYRPHLSVFQGNYHSQGASWTLNPSYESPTRQGPHGSTISLWKDNATIDSLQMHGGGHTALFRCYPDTPPTNGFEDITIKNCLFYDPCTPQLVHLYNMGDRINVLNNTFCNSLSQYPLYRPMYYYSTVITNYDADSTGTDINFYNNIFVGALECSSSTPMNEDYNIFWSFRQNGTYIQNSYGANDIVVAYGPSGSYGTFNDSYTWTYFADVFVSPDFAGQHGNDMLDELKLKAGSDAIGFGNTLYAPTLDLLGTTRGSPPDAGALEY